MDSVVINDTFNVSLQISRSIFVCGETIQMHTFKENNHTVIKLPCNGNSKAKNINENTIQFIEVIKHN